MENEALLIPPESTILSLSLTAFLPFPAWPSKNKGDSSLLTPAVSRKTDNK